MAPKVLYNDRVKDLIKNYKEGASHVASDLMFANGHSISLEVSRQSSCNSVDKHGCHLRLHMCVIWGFWHIPTLRKGRKIVWILDLICNTGSPALLEEDMQEFADLYTGNSLGNTHENEFWGNRRRKAEIILRKAEFISFGALSRKSRHSGEYKQLWGVQIPCSFVWAQK